MNTLDKNKTAGTLGRQGRAEDNLGPNSEIGRKLKQYYDDLVQDQVPDRFAQLLSQLEKAETSQGKD